MSFVAVIFPQFKVLQKFQKNQNKNQQNGSFRNPEGGPGGPHLAPRRPGGAAPPLAAPPGRLGTPGGPWLPPLAYITSSSQKPSRRTPHHEIPLCSTAAALPRSGAPEDLFPAPCRREGSPPGASPPPFALPGCVVSSPPWTMGP